MISKVILEKVKIFKIIMTKMKQGVEEKMFCRIINQALTSNKKGCPQLIFWEIDLKSLIYIQKIHQWRAKIKISQDPNIIKI